MTKADASEIGGKLLRAGSVTNTTIFGIIRPKKRAGSTENLGGFHIRVHDQEITVAHETLECKALASQLSFDPLELIEKFLKEICTGTIDIGPSDGNRYSASNVYVRRLVRD